MLSMLPLGLPPLAERARTCLLAVVLVVTASFAVQAGLPPVPDLLGRREAGAAARGYGDTDTFWSALPALAESLGALAAPATRAGSAATAGAATAATLSATAGTAAAAPAQALAPASSTPSPTGGATAVAPRPATAPAIKAPPPKSPQRPMSGHQSPPPPPSSDAAPPEPPDTSGGASGSPGTSSGGGSATTPGPAPVEAPKAGRTAPPTT